MRSKKSTHSIAKLYCPLAVVRSEEHTSELQSRQYLVCRLLLEKKNVALTVGVFLLLFGAGLWAFTRMGHRFAMVERGVGLVKKKRRIAFSVFFFNDTATTEIYTLSLHDALPIFQTIRYGKTGQQNEHITESPILGKITVSLHNNLHEVKEKHAQHCQTVLPTGCSKIGRAHV